MSLRSLLEYMGIDTDLVEIDGDPLVDIPDFDPVAEGREFDCS